MLVKKILRKNWKVKYSVWMILLTLLFSGCGSTVVIEVVTQAPETTEARQLAGISQDVLEESPLQVHFIDVGQADCTLIVCDDEAMLIDGGDREDAKTICSYLDAQNVDELKYAIGTHPHEDHIGSLDDVLYHVDVDQLILPPADYDSRYAIDVEEAAEDNDVPIKISKVGDVYTLGDAEFTILGPVYDYDDEWNNWSVSLRLVYGENSFIFTGDAEMEAEYDMCDTGLPMKAQVYQVGHHGSSTSTSEALMKAVRPEYAVISCEKGNDYGHPHVETMEILAEYGVSVFRTDEQGTIVAVCDGKVINWSTAPKIEAEAKESTSAQAVVKKYVLNTSSKRFHLPECGGVSQMAENNREDFTGTRQELVEQGYIPCGSCEP